MHSSRSILAALLVVLASPALARITAPGANDADIWCAGPTSFEDCVDKVGNLIPTTDNTQTSGTSALRWSNVYGVSFTGSGAALTGIPSTGSIVGVYLPLAGGTLTGQLALSTVAGNGNGVTLSTGVTATSTFTVQGNAFSVGGSTFTVAGGSATVAYRLTAGSFTGAGTGLTGTAASLTAGNVTTNANMTGDVTSVGNATTAAATQSNITTLSAANGVTETSTFTIKGNAFSVGGSTFIVSGGTISIHGVSDGSSAPIGYVGEYVSCQAPGGTNLAASTTFKDLCSVSITAGDWDCSLMYGLTGVGSTVASAISGIGTVTGNDSTGLVYEDSRCDLGALNSANSNQAPCPIVSYRENVTTTTTLYAKMYANYTGSTPVGYGRLSCRRIR